MLIRGARHRVRSRHHGDGSIAARDLFVKGMQLTHERSERSAHTCRKRLVAFRHDEIRQFAGVFEPLRRDHAELSQMPAQCVDQLRALRNQHVARLVMHERRLVLQRSPHERRPAPRTMDATDTKAFGIRSRGRS
jgi:hypothetical protein